MDVLLAWLGLTAPGSLSGQAAGSLVGTLPGAENYPDQVVFVVHCITAAIGAICIIGIAQRQAWVWPIGLVVHVAFLIVPLVNARYVDAGLQLVFAGLCGYGWFAWRRPDRPDARGIRRASGRQIAYGVVLTAIATVIVTYLLADQNDAVVDWLDAFVVAASLLALVAQANKLIEAWWVWIVTGCVVTAARAVEGQWAVAVLCLALVALCGYGLVGWSRQVRASRPDSDDEAVDETESVRT